MSVTRLALLAIMVTPLVVYSQGLSHSWRSAWLTLPRRRLMLAALLVAGYIHAAWHLLGNTPGHDSLAYRGADLGALYGSEYGTTGLFTYSPVAAIVAQPLGLIPEDVFAWGWTAMLVVAAVWLARSESLIWLAFPPLIWLVVIGNIEILLGVVVVLGFRHPWVWSFALLTKVTPGVGLLWFAVRREWRNLSIALGFTAVLVIGSYALLPDAWHAWVSFLLESNGTGGWMPLWPRVVVAAVLVSWGGLTDRPWTVVVVAIIAVPHFWFASLGGLVAVAALGFSWRAAVDRSASVRPQARLGASSLVR